MDGSAATRAEVGLYARIYLGLACDEILKYPYYPDVYVADSCDHVAYRKFEIGYFNPIRRIYCATSTMV